MIADIALRLLSLTIENVAGELRCCLRLLADSFDAAWIGLLHPDASDWRIASHSRERDSSTLLASIDADSLPWLLGSDTEPVILRPAQLKQLFDRQNSRTGVSPESAAALMLQFGRNGTGRLIVVARSQRQIDEWTLKNLQPLARLCDGLWQHCRKLLCAPEQNRLEMTLVREIHHRVKNNLQVVCSLLDLQSENAGSPELEGLFDIGIQRVRAIAIVHEQLYRSSTGTQLDLGEYLNALLQDLLRLYRVDRDTRELQVDVKDVNLGFDAAIPCCLIINELVTNALQHAFRDDRPGRIHISAVENKSDGRLTLRIADNGVGMTAGSRQKTKPTLGLELVKNLVKQLDGSLTIDTTDGTSFQVSFFQPTNPQ